MDAILLLWIVLASPVLVGFLAFLALCAFVVVRTGDTAGLRDVAVAVRAFRGALSLRSV